MDKVFMGRIKMSNGGTFDKGIEVKDSMEAAKQSYHAYLGAYAYGHDASTDYVACYIVDGAGNRKMWEIWERPVQAEE